MVCPHCLGCPNSAGNVEIIDEGGAHNVGSTASSLSRHDIEVRVRGGIQTELAAWQATSLSRLPLVNTRPSRLGPTRLTCWVSVSQGFPL